MSESIPLPTLDELAERIRSCRDELAALRKLQRMARMAQAAHAARQHRRTIASTNQSPRTGTDPPRDPTSDRLSAPTNDQHGAPEGGDQ
jgi:hypothetical protein